MASKPAKKDGALKTKKAPAFKASEIPSTAKSFLHTSSGAARKERTTKGFNVPEWHEVRLDADKAMSPDIVSSMTDMSAIEDDSFDALFSNHNLQCLYVHEVPAALAEFKRVLKPDGFAVITCPDLQSVCDMVVQNKLTTAIYTSAVGPITPIDLLYGHRASVANGHSRMAHHCGFTKDVLSATLMASGFAAIAALQRAHPYYDLWVIATKSKIEKSVLEQLVKEHFPN
jgi:hypothetical protein